MMNSHWEMSFGTIRSFITYLPEKSRPLLVNIFNIVLKLSSTETPWAGESIPAVNKLSKQRRWSNITTKPDPESPSSDAVGCVSLLYNRC